MDRLSFSSDLAKALANADLVIESIPEDPSIKKRFYKKLAAVAPEKTIFVNSSTMLPSQFADQQVDQLNLQPTFCQRDMET
jgi:3-hydroxybutyryl-CoA dehydrogenase